MRPNIVLIVADDLGYGDLGCWNGGLSQTPALDALVAEGVSLAQHYSASPVCAPARAALLTGRHPHRTGAIDTLELRGLDRLALRETTIADLLRRAGYATGMVGKWHNGALDPRYHPNRRGFEEFAGFSGGWHPYFDWRLDRNGVESKSDGRYLTDVFTDEAIGFIERHARAPFFLYLAYSAPHFPFEAPAEDVAPFAETGRFTRAVATLYGMVRAMDRGVARVREALARSGLEQNTLVLFTSDNGPQFGGKGDD
ncbi:MAG: sulfatase-like hydrolase/transferase, partial [Solirubrobacteraceae bacterium]